MSRTPEQWRRSILKAEGIKPGPRLYLTYLAEHMNHKRIVSRPRHLIAKDLGTSPRTVDYWNSAAVKAGLLSVIVRGQKGVTAVYQGLFPDVQRATCLRAETDVKLRAELPNTPVQRAKDCAPVVPQTTRTAPTAWVGRRNEKRSDEKQVGRTVASDLTGCEWHRDSWCPDDCRNASQARADRRESA